jgi:hypothetical protein
MRCPKCQFDHPSQTTECLKCGVVFSRYHELPTVPVAAAVANEAVAVPIPPAVAPLEPIERSAPTSPRKEALRELNYRILALPLALLLGRLVASSGMNVLGGLLAMPLHESGHAITAWLTGRWAVPMLWVTMHGEQRSWLIVFMLSAAIIFAGYVGWRLEHWGWVCIAGAVLIVQFAFLNLPSGPLIVFGGDGGAFVLGTIFMMSFYAPRESKLYRSWGVRWGLLVIGALGFMYVYHLWSGPWENIPFGELEGVNLSDPSLLTELYGWSVIQLVDRYLRLAMFCFAGLAIAYVWGLISAYLQLRSAPQEPANP